MARYRLKDGKVIQFTTSEETARDIEEKAWEDGQADRDLAELRNQRTLLLAETDFYANTDVTMTDKMKAYRQELRDITKTFKSMNDKDFKFPTKPTD
tara:strand:+ start:267 stop:557 length:291 start_codon:yes stop_codon:yes gene_type:complete